MCACACVFKNVRTFDLNDVSGVDAVELNGVCKESDLQVAIMLNGGMYVRMCMCVFVCTCV